ncbi:hypothetical protein OIU74_003202 [Salix koriyanagi]|uniref:Uncharacterized protein n=1 Tax=Salix koriyanagi TaxID=2511006 RepID=A0A9Q0UXA2_9ROSI|nr:hypothetical protein OIU74_003202 [Salix koriyanagi]
MMTIPMIENHPSILTLHQCIIINHLLMIHHHRLKRQSNGGCTGIKIKIQRCITARELNGTMTGALITATATVILVGSFLAVVDRDNVFLSVLARWIWKVSFGLRTTELTSGSIVGTCSFLRRVESAKPNPALLTRVSYLGSVPSPRPLFSLL